MGCFYSVAKHKAAFLLDRESGSLYNLWSLAFLAKQEGWA